MSSLTWRRLFVCATNRRAALAINGRLRPFLRRRKAHPRESQRPSRRLGAGKYPKSARRARKRPSPWTAGSFCSARRPHNIVRGSLPPPSGYARWRAALKSVKATKGSQTLLGVALWAAGAVCLAVQTLLPGFIGIANNGDFGKVYGWLCLAPRRTDTNFNYIQPDAFRAVRGY